MRSVLLVLFLLLPSMGQAQTHLPDASRRFAWDSESRSAAILLSNLTLASQFTLDTIHSFRSDNRKRAFLRQGCKEVLSQGSTQLVKHLFSKTRPDGSDNRSAWSGHSSDSMAASGWKYSIGVPLSALTGYFRVAGAKHDMLDIFFGFGAGIGIDWACDAIIKGDS